MADDLHEPSVPFQPKVCFGKSHAMPLAWDFSPQVFGLDTRPASHRCARTRQRQRREPGRRGVPRTASKPRLLAGDHSSTPDFFARSDSNPSLVRQCANGTAESEDWEAVQASYYHALDTVARERKRRCGLLVETHEGRDGPSKLTVSRRIDHEYRRPIKHLHPTSGANGTSDETEINTAKFLARVTQPVDQKHGAEPSRTVYADQEAEAAPESGELLELMDMLALSKA